MLYLSVHFVSNISFHYFCKWGYILSTILLSKDMVNIACMIASSAVIVLRLYTALSTPFICSAVYTLCLREKRPTLSSPIDVPNYKKKKFWNILTCHISRIHLSSAHIFSHPSHVYCVIVSWMKWKLMCLYIVLQWVVSNVQQRWCESVETAHIGSAFCPAFVWKFQY